MCPAGKSQYEIEYENKLLFELSEKIKDSANNHIYIYPGIAIIGYVLKGMLVIEELKYFSIETLEKFAKSYILKDRIVFINIGSKSLTIGAAFVKMVHKKKYYTIGKNKELSKLIELYL